MVRLTKEFKFWPGIAPILASISDICCFVASLTRQLQPQLLLYSLLSFIHKPKYSPESAMLQNTAIAPGGSNV
jgi:hypothetical protein